MANLDVDEAANRLEDLIASLRSGAHHEIVIEMDGAPAARLLPIQPTEKLLPRARKSQSNI